MQVNRPLQNLFQRLDTDRNGISAGELQSLDPNQDGQVSESEASAAGIQEASDRALLNQALQKTRAPGLQTQDLVFSLSTASGASEASYSFVEDPPAAAAETVRTPGNSSQSDRMSQLAFDPMDPDIARRLVRLDQALGGSGQNVMGGAFSYRPLPASGSTARMNVAGATDISSFNDLQSLNRNTVQDYLAQTNGSPPSQAEIDAYIQQHGEDMAQQLGNDLSGKYSNWTQIGLTGDVNTFAPFQSSGSDDKSQVVVCTNIHAAVAAYRREILGQEAYVMTTNGNDQAHIVTVFKDNQTNQWNIQNYGTVVQTEAGDLRDLFENYLPDQRQILLGDVTEDGLRVLRNVKTPLGEQELRFRSQLGAGNYHPGMGSGNLQLGTDQLGSTFDLGPGQANVNFDPRSNTLGLNYHLRSQNADGLHTRGVGIEVQDHTNAHGFERQRIDAKYESENVNIEQRSPAHERFTRSYWNVHAGMEDTSLSGPIYWQNNEDSGPAARLGGLYSYTQNNLLGSQPLRLEAGYQFNAGTTYTMGTEGSQPFTNYITRTLGDSVLEGKGNLGLRYDSNGFMARTGINAGLNAANINGFNDLGLQMDNMFGMDAYGEMAYTSNRLRVGVMGNADLRHPGVFQVGARSELFLTDKTSWSTVLSHQNDPLLGNRSAIMTGLQSEFAPGFSVYGQVGSDLEGRAQGNVGLMWRPGARR